MKKCKEMKHKSVFPKGFFSKERPEIDLKTSLKDVIPVEWANNFNNKDAKNCLDKKSC